MMSEQFADMFSHLTGTMGRSQVPQPKLRRGATYVPLGEDEEDADISEFLDDVFDRLPAGRGRDDWLRVIPLPKEPPAPYDPRVESPNMMPSRVEPVDYLCKCTGSVEAIGTESASAVELQGPTIAVKERLVQWNPASLKYPQDEAYAKRDFPNWLEYFGSDVIATDNDKTKKSRLMRYFFPKAKQAKASIFEVKRKQLVTPNSEQPGTTVDVVEVEYKLSPTEAEPGAIAKEGSFKLIKAPRPNKQDPDFQEEYIKPMLMLEFQDEDAETPKTGPISFRLFEKISAMLKEKESSIAKLLREAFMIGYNPSVRSGKRVSARNIPPPGTSWVFKGRETEKEKASALEVTSAAAVGAVLKIDEEIIDDSLDALIKDKDFILSQSRQQRIRKINDGLRAAEQTRPSFRSEDRLKMKLLQNAASTMIEVVKEQVNEEKEQNVRTESRVLAVTCHNACLNLVRDADGQEGGIRGTFKSTAPNMIRSALVPFSATALASQETINDRVQSYLRINPSPDKEPSQFTSHLLVPDRPGGSLTNVLTYIGLLRPGSSGSLAHVATLNGGKVNSLT
ncbi:unnamed protein product [Amoebophrya sp. A120]|nr:unnamed protein product [Amoebophrya sp. A120]|eukprot:GSA120T00000743001.1